MTQLLMTPGPTFVRENVRQAMAEQIINPDIDMDFYELYKETCQMVQKIIRTKEEVLILDGEGILGLEAACASLIEPGDRVLVISNGIFGAGFGDFVEMYDGIPVYFEGDFREPIDIEALEAFLEKDSDFKIATLVHCETPSGLINPIETICPMLKRYGILSVVDAVSSIAGIPIETDKWEIDLLLGGSQKCLSAAPGLTFLSVSRAAKALMANRDSKIRGFYANLTIWDGWYDKRWFPYTQPVSAIYGFNRALKNYFADGRVLERHANQAKRVREEVLSMGFDLYPKSGFSDTCTAIMVPEGMDEKGFRDKMLNEHGILISGAFGPLEGKVIRIGHMGDNCDGDKVDRTLKAMRALLGQ